MLPPNSFRSVRAVKVEHIGGAINGVITVLANCLELLFMSAPRGGETHYTSSDETNCGASGSRVTAACAAVATIDSAEGYHIEWPWTWSAAGPRGSTLLTDSSSGRSYSGRCSNVRRPEWNKGNSSFRTSWDKTQKLTFFCWRPCKQIILQL